MKYFERAAKSIETHLSENNKAAFYSTQVSFRSALLCFQQFVSCLAPLSIIFFRSAIPAQISSDCNFNSSVVFDVFSLGLEAVA